MTGTTKTNFRAGIDLRGITADLESVRLGLGRELTAELLAAGQPILTAARAFTPLGPGPTSTHGSHALPHIRDTLEVTARGSRLTLSSRHPGSGVLNYGGVIHPRGVEIKFPKRLFGQRAGEQEMPRIERDLADRADRLLRAHGL